MWLGSLDLAHRVDVARFGGQVNITTWSDGMCMVFFNGISITKPPYGGYEML
jgi:hypothetical protein